MPTLRAKFVRAQDNQPANSSVEPYVVPTLSQTYEQWRLRRRTHNMESPMVARVIRIG